MASQDIIRLREICKAQRRYEDLDYVIFADERGEILAHSDTAKTGLFLTDLPSENPQPLVRRYVDFTDVVQPVYFKDAWIGWIRLGVNHAEATRRLQAILQKGAVYLLLALLLSVVTALLTARYIVGRLTVLKNNIARVEAGETTLRNQIKGEDEIASLAKAFDHLMDTLQFREKDLLLSRRQFEELFNASPVAMVFLQEQPLKIIPNDAFLSLFGYDTNDIKSMDDWWLKAYPDAHYRESIQKLWHEMVARSSATGEPIPPTEVKICNKFGQTLSILVSAKLINNLLLVIFYDITERTAAEAVLRRALNDAQMMRDAMDVEPVYVYMKNLQRQYTYGNKITLALFGCDEKSIVGTVDEDYFPPETAAQIREIDEEVLKGNNTKQIVPVKNADGTETIYLEIKSPIYDTQGNITGLLGVSTDITEQENAKRKEREEREKLEKIASRLPGMIYQFRMKPDGSVSFPYVSEAIRQIYELEPEEVQNDASIVFERVHPDDLEKGLQSVQESASTLKPWIHEYRYIAKDGSIKYLKGNALPQREEDGSILWHGFISDITAQKQAEHEFFATMELQSNILKMVPAGIFCKDRSLRYLGCNEVFMRNLGMNDVNQIIGKTDFALAPVAAAEKYRADDLKVIETEQPLYGQRKTFLAPDGTTKHILTNKTPLRNLKGEVIGVLGTYIDITALTETQELLQNTSRLYLLISQLNQMFIRHKDQKLLLQETCNMMVKYGGFLMCWIGTADPATGKVIPLYISGKEEGYLSDIKGISVKNIPEGRGPTGTAIRERRLVYTQDISVDPLMLPWREEALKRGYRSTMAVPLIVNGEVKYAMSVYSGKAFHFSDEKEIVLMQEIADDLSFTLTALENEKQKALAEKRVSDYSYALNESAIVDISDSRGRIQFANDNFYKITGYTPEEVLGQDHKILKSGYHDQAFYEKLWSTVLQGKTWKGEVKNKTKDGRYFWVDTTIVPFVDDEGKPQQFICIRYDITDRKNAEAEKLLALERYEFITQATSDTIWDWDVKENTIVYSQNFTATYGHKQRVIHNNLEWFKAHVYPDDWNHLYEMLQQAFKMHRHKIQHEYRFLCANGTYKYVLDRAFIIYNEQKQPVRVIGSMQDITREKELTQQIENAVIRAQEREWNQLGMELHDNVNQILAASMIYLSFAQEKIKAQKDASVEVSKSEEMIRNAIQEIRRLSHQLAPASVEKMNIRQVIETLVETMSLHEQFQVHLELENAEELPMTTNLQTQMYRIMQEQFNNILKHAHAKNVIIGLRKTDTHLILRIADDGKGQDRRKTKTGGIGMENIRRRVAMFGGSLRVTSAPGKGYTLQIEIPLRNL